MKIGPKLVTTIERMKFFAQGFWRYCKFASYCVCPNLPIIFIVIYTPFPKVDLAADYNIHLKMMQLLAGISNIYKIMKQFKKAEWRSGSVLGP